MIERSINKNENKTKSKTNNILYTMYMICYFSFGHCIVCPSTYRFLLPYLVSAIVLFFLNKNE
jgi:hypothetical protein